ncbi:MAG TPA: hypothetical protein VK832_14965 [Burkholderiaceae bacterium]|nr:hypothetical protein [Burkholderiaceae bacterium]
MAGVIPIWLAVFCIPAAAQPAEFNFGVIGQVITTANDGSPLVQAITESDADDLAFVVANGFKRVDETCSDQLYELRRDLLSNAKNGLILSLAGSDWSECKNANGHSTAVERLSRLRELFFVDEFSFGASKIPLIRQSNAAKYRSYVENARWAVGSVLFTSVNLPSMNNHYRMEAGRNSEFEDRLIANRDWLHHTFAVAKFNHMTSVVLICDGDPLQKPGTQRLFDSNIKRDGFAEIRQQLTALAGKFPGKVLIIHNRFDGRGARSDAIVWHGNVGELEVGTEWVKVGVKAENPARFNATRGGADSKTGNQ